jgi:branched-chain amino acid aminotransferase
MKWSVEELIQATVDTVAANDLRACYLRPVAVRTGEQMGFYPIGIPVETFIIAYNWGAYLGHEALVNGVDVSVSSWRRAAPDTFPTLAKAGGNYLSSQLSKAQARIDGYAEGIMLDSFGYVAEGSGENLFIVRDEVLYTSPVSAGILHGITRDSVMRIARDLELEIREQNIPREMLYIADELFFSGTAAELTPIRSVDRIEIGGGKPGPLTQAIQDRFMAIAKGRTADPYGWLTPVPVAVGAGS